MTILMPGISIEDDDTRCKAYLAFHGKLEALMPRQGFPRTFCVFGDEQTITVAAHFSGYDDPKDNGYNLTIIQRAAFTEEQLAQIIQMCIETGRDESGPCYFKEVECNEEAN